MYSDGDEVLVVLLHVVVVDLVHDEPVKDGDLPIHTVIMWS